MGPGSDQLRLRVLPGADVPADRSAELGVLLSCFGTTSLNGTRAHGGVTDTIEIERTQDS